MFSYHSCSCYPRESVLTFWDLWSWITQGRLWREPSVWPGRAHRAAWGGQGLWSQYCCCREPTETIRKGWTLMYWIFKKKKKYAAGLIWTGSNHHNHQSPLQVLEICELIYLHNSCSHICSNAGFPFLFFYSVRKVLLLCYKNKNKYYMQQGINSSHHRTVLQFSIFVFVYFN